MDFESDPDTSAVRLVEAVLEGGPANLPNELRTHHVLHTDEKIKVPYLDGYEHFECASVTDTGGTPVVFRWTGRTRVAE
ncbi:DUF5988 family protein [Paractinoplanes durhamensis]|uniref:Uncharacterized protein n=1 Tax=Paractinoplanes durhamensis TaxID=113563 RepID=A0ABQ3ZDM7_9ACTN|nr:DUF5988 family protein [Actinoplanes durhamensis]GIE07881.1 hypothetical protein Adu01nite_92310 [Actinoplanes durhamensis]